MGGRICEQRNCQSAAKARTGKPRRIRLWENSLVVIFWLVPSKNCPGKHTFGSPHLLGFVRPNIYRHRGIDQLCGKQRWFLAMMFGWWWVENNEIFLGRSFDLKKNMLWKYSSDVYFYAYLGKMSILGSWFFSNGLKPSAGFLVETVLKCVHFLEAG